MITVYESTAEDFTTNGLAVLTPKACTLSETINGEWELLLEHPVDENGKWRYLVAGNILRVPVPSAPSPKASMKSATIVYIYKPTKSVTLMSKPTKGAKVCKVGTKDSLILLEKTTSTAWLFEAPNGTTGYLNPRFAVLDNEATTSGVTYEQAKKTYSKNEQLREQPFRIYKSEPQLGYISVSARHIFYDLADNMIDKLEPKETDIAEDVFKSIGDIALSEHPFSFHSNIYAVAKNVSWIGKNPVECMMGDEGFTGLYGGEIGRDWFDVYAMDELGQDSGVQIREGKNLTGITYTIDTTNVATRIMPVGQTKKGDPLYLKGTRWIDSQNHFNDYPHPMWNYMEVENAKIGSKDDNNKTITEAKALENMRKAAEEAFENGCDLPEITVDVKFVNLADTEEYADYKALQNIYIGDTVGVFVKSLGIQVAMRMTQYTYDCLKKQYTEMTLGKAHEALEGASISGRNITSGSIASSALATGAVDARTLGEDVISTRHLQAASVVTEILAADSVTAVNIAADAVTSEKIKAGSITADKLAAGSITADKIDTDTLNAKVVNAVEGNFETIAANSASLTDATVRHLIANTLNVTDAVGESVYIDNLALNSVQAVSATVGQLVVKASDGKYYRLDFDSDGKLNPTEVTVSAGEASAGVTADGASRIIETSLTATELSATNLKAVTALINKLSADQIDAGTLVASSAFVSALQTSEIFSDTGSIMIRVGQVATSAANEAVGDIGTTAQSALSAAQTAESNASTALGRTDSAVTETVTHYLASAKAKNVTTSEPGWTTEPQAKTKKLKYLWIYYTYTLFDGTKVDSVPSINGTASTGISDVKAQYFVSVSDTEAVNPNANWSETIPDNVSGRYIWSRLFVTYENGTTGIINQRYDEELTQAAHSEALNDIMFDSTDGVGTVYVSGSEPDSPSVNDLWMSTSAQKVYRRVHRSNAYTWMDITSRGFAKELLSAARSSDMSDGMFMTYCLYPVSPVSGTDEVADASLGNICMVKTGVLYSQYLKTDSGWEAHDTKNDVCMVLEENEFRLLKYNGTQWVYVNVGAGDLWMNRDTDIIYLFRNGGWVDTGYDIGGLLDDVAAVESTAREQENTISEIKAKTQHFVFDASGFHVKNDDGTSELLLTSASVQISTGGESETHYSEFTSDYARFGNYKLRITNDGGMAFIYDETM